MIRKPAVSGLFYDDDPEILRKAIENCFKHELGPGEIPKLNTSNHLNDNEIYGILAPHAGYSYSGPIAAHAYYHLVKQGFPETFIILCPNHTGIGSGVSIFDEGIWNTPLGDIEIDNEFATELLNNVDIINSDSSAHLKEHSCEIHLPFLQYFTNNFKIVPIVMWMQDIETSNDLSRGIVEIANKLKTSISIIASTDLTHYAPKEIAYKQDKLILDKIASMDEIGMMNEINKFNITMCGYGPTMTTIKATRKLGANKCEILKYATSGDISGDSSSVVGYCSGIFI